MIENAFSAAMTDEEFLSGETRHQKAEQSRKLAMAAGLTKTSEKLKQVWESNPQLFLKDRGGQFSSLSPKDSPRVASTSIISVNDFLPRLGP